MKQKTLTFLLGLVVGIVAYWTVPGLVSPYLPQAFKGEGTTGTVTGKRLDNSTLLLAIDTADGALLAKFTQKVYEIDLLVEEGDEISFDMGHYEPFIDDPSVNGVKKQKPMQLDSGSQEESPAQTTPPAATNPQQTTPVSPTPQTPAVDSPVDSVPQEGGGAASLDPAQRLTQKPADMESPESDDSDGVQR